MKGHLVLALGSGGAGVLRALGLDPGRESQTTDRAFPQARFVMLDAHPVMPEELLHSYGGGIWQGMDPAAVRGVLTNPEAFPYFRNWLGPAPSLLKTFEEVYRPGNGVSHRHFGRILFNLYRAQELHARLVDHARNLRLTARELHLHAWRLQEWQDDAFVARLIEFLARFEGRIPYSQIRPLLDFLHDCRQRRRDFSLKGRTPEALIRQMHAWHEELALNTQLTQLNAQWEPVPVNGLDYSDKEKRRFRIVQLTTAKELVEEGKALRHCVAGYAGRAAKGQCYIWSMRLETPDSGAFERMVTIELSRKRHIVQVRGLQNSLPDSLAIKILQIWQKETGAPTYW